MVREWMMNNKVATAFVLGALVAGLYTMYIFLDNAEEAERNAAHAADESPEGAEVKHVRRAGRRNA